MPPFHHPTDSSEDIAKTVNSETILHSNLHFPFSLADDTSNLYSDDDDRTSAERAFEHVFTNSQAPIIGRKRAISVMAIDIDNHRQKRKISSECAPKWTPEGKNFPFLLILRRSLRRLPNCTTRFSVLLLSTSHRSLITILKRSHATALSSYPEHPKVQTPATPPPGTSASAHTDENAIIHGDELNCPALADGIGPMSKRDPSAENAVNLNCNDDISNNGLTVVNMSATTSINSQCTENSRNRVHLYAPEVTRSSDTTHTSTTDGTRTKPMTEIFIKNFQDNNAEFPTTNSPPTTDDQLATLPTTLRTR
jgi:hypothetical protein